MNSARTLLATAVVTLFIGTTSASAATYERTYFIDTSVGVYRSGGADLERIPIEPFTPAAGDQLVLHLILDKPLLVEDFGPGSPLEGIEGVSVLLDSGATTSGGVDARSSGTFWIADATGALLTPTFGFAGAGGGFGIAALRYLNLTDTAFAFSRIDLTWNILALNFYPPSDSFRYVWLKIRADRVSIVDVPTPEVLLEQLSANVTGIGPGTSLADKVMLAQTYLAVPDIAATCAMLYDFNNQVGALSGKKVDSSLASELIEESNAIIEALDCE